MTRGVFIAGTDTDVGKTRVTQALLRALAATGVRAAGMKPVATGCRPLTASELAMAGGFYSAGDMINDDVASLIALSPPDCPRIDINPYCFDWGVSPHIAADRDGVRIEPEHVAAAYGRLAAQVDAVVVEGTGDWTCRWCLRSDCGSAASIMRC